MHFSRELCRGSLFLLKLVHTYATCIIIYFCLPLLLSHSPFLSICIIESKYIFVGYSIYPKYLIFCTTGTYIHIFQHCSMEFFPMWCNFCSALHITADTTFNEAFNIQKGCVDGEELSHSLLILSSFGFPLPLPLFLSFSLFLTF